MYKCQQCGNKAEVQGQQDIDSNYGTPFISEWVVCESCDYTISKDAADKQVLLIALKFTQKALANWRDGKDITEHPVHGHLHLEEVKYCIVDEAIAQVENQAV